MIPALAFAVAPPAEVLEGEQDLTFANGRVLPYGTLSPKVLMRAPIEVRGSMRSPELASEAARAYLKRILEEHAPGTRVEDFVEVSNVVMQGMRTIGYQQTHNGMPVMGGQVSFRFKKDRLFMAVTSAWARPQSQRPAQLVSRGEAEASAERHLFQKLGIEGTAEAMSGPMVLTIPGSVPSANSDRAVVEVKVRSRNPIALYAVYVDATTGVAVARRQTLMFASGALKMNAPVRRPGAEREDYDAREAAVVIDGSNAFADQVGSVTWSTDQNARVTLIPRGPRVNVYNEQMQTASVAVSLADGASFTWDMRNNELIDAYTSAYVSVLRVKDYAKTMAPWLDWLDDNQLPTIINIADVCNAFSDGDTINFFRSGQGCENTARLPDVVYHEFGHALHFQVITPGAGTFDSALSEGIADYLAASITGDPATARGFFQDDAPLRDIDPADSEARWPEGISRDPHETGLIIAGALWDLRKAMIEQFGESEAIRMINQYYIAILARAGNIPAAYNEVLAVDDDDGDLTNGTPNLCLIYDNFAKHGLGGAGVSLPTIDGTNVVVGVAGANQCPGSRVATARIDWEYRGEPGSGGTIDLVEGDGSWSASLPTDRQRVVVRYRVTVALANGTAFAWPNNVADPQYEKYIGEVEPIYCTDFETDPFNEGWEHHALSEGDPDEIDDWMFGEPRAVFGSGDPNSAHSGIGVIGNDLAPTDEYDGRYNPEASSAAYSPAIDVSGSSMVRLHYYRWLNVEDGRGDQAIIRANGVEAWNNATTMMGEPQTDHRDTEWRFQDVDLTPMISEGQVMVSFELTTNRRRRYGGWNIDTFCVVRPVVACGDTFQEGEEACDDGNFTDGDGCQANCTLTPAPVCGNNQQEAGEACDDGNAIAGDGCEANCTVTVMMPVDPNNMLMEIEDDGCSCSSTRSQADLSGALFVVALGALFVLRSRRR